MTTPDLSTPRGLAVDGGVTRAVLLIGPYAVKVPRLRYGWANLLSGLLSNMTEARFAGLANQFCLCPTVLSVPGGFLNVQRRCQALTDDEWEMTRLNHDDVHGRGDWQGMACDFKRDNFGTIGGRIVLLDYGELQ